jgi:hypothetical protein
MHDDAEHPGRGDEPRVVNASIPEWAKFAGTIIATTILVVGWVEARFVSRVEWSNHQAQQTTDMERLSRTQAEYAAAERVTATGLGDINERLGTIETDVGWLRAYLDVSRPAPKKKANGAGTHR